MATSEYIRNGSTGTNGRAKVSQLPSASRRWGIGPAAATAAVMIINDLLMILVAFGLSVVLRMAVATRVAWVAGRPTAWATPAELAYFGWFAVAYVLVARRYGLYSPTPLGRSSHELRLVMQGCLTAGLLLSGALFLFHGIMVSRVLVLLLVLATMVTLGVRRFWWRYSRLRHYEQGLELRNVMVVGTNQLSCVLGRYMDAHRQLGCRFVGFVSVPGAAIRGEIEPGEILGNVEKLRQLIRQNFVDEVVIGEFFPIEHVIRILEEARDLDIDVRAVAGYYSELTAMAPLEYLGIFPVAALHRRRSQAVGLFCKRIVDILLSLGALIVAAPLMAAVALAVKLDSAGPVFYVSERIGRRGRVFRCFKFRTMVKNAESMKKDLDALNERDGILFKMSNDPRITRLGAFLRKYSLDELPQFLNVLRGEMSIVGPRPPIASEVEKYQLEHFRRLEVLPGLTGLWQVEARHDPSFAKYIELDTAYVENWSIGLDLRILVRTANVVLRGTGT
ncbi:MAG: sugar transferase [Acidobacteriaceae bacterium]